MAMYSPSECVDAFKEAGTFTAVVCRVLVQEVRVRAANQKTEQAAEAIAAFLQPPGDGGDCRGWTLLNAIYYLVSRHFLLLHNLNPTMLAVGRWW